MAAKKTPVKSTEPLALLTEQLKGTGQAINIQIPDTADQAWSMAISLENEAAINMAKRGILYLWLKEQLPHGAFEKELEDRGIAQRTARDAMSVAQMLAGLPKPTLNKLAPLAGSKLIELARVPIETLEEMDDKGELDDIDRMPVRDLKSHLRRERMAREKAENRYTALQKAQKKAQTLAALEDDEQWHELTRTFRRESDALAEQGSLAADGMEHLLSLLGDPKFDLDAANQNAAITTLYHQARAPFAKLWRLLDEMQKHFGDVIAMDDSALPLFSEQEAEQALATRSLLLGEHRARVDARSDKNQPTPRRRGPKKKSK